MLQVFHSQKQNLNAKTNVTNEMLQTWWNTSNSSAV